LKRQELGITDYSLISIISFSVLFLQEKSCGRESSEFISTVTMVTKLVLKVVINIGEEPRAYGCQIK
jgi:hypothetical protein